MNTTQTEVFITTDHKAELDRMLNFGLATVYHITNSEGRRLQVLHTPSGTGLTSGILRPFALLKEQTEAYLKFEKEQ